MSSFSVVPPQPEVVKTWPNAEKNCLLIPIQKITAILFFGEKNNLRTSYAEE